MNSACPSSYRQSYSFTLGDYLAVWQPLSRHGLVVISRGPMMVYKLCDGTNSLAQITKKLRRYDKNLTEEHVSRILIDLEKYELIFWNYPPKHELTFSLPKTLAVWVHTTNQCNLRCTYCYLNKTNEHMSDDVAFRLIDRVLSSAKDNGFVRVKFKYSGGEVLLGFDRVLKQIKYSREKAHQLGIGVDSVILTNAVLLTRDIANVLKRENVRVMVSLDGSKRHHDKVRVFPGGGSTYDFVMRGIKNLRDAKVDFNLSITVTNDNIDGIPKLVAYLLKNNIRFVINFFRENVEAGDQLNLSDEKLISVMKKIYRMVERNLPPYPVWDSLLDRVTMSKQHENACGVGRNYVTIDQNGYLAACPVVIKDKIGHIDENIVEVMRNRTFMKDITVHKKSPCSSCMWRYVCSGGCPLLTKKLKDTYLANSPYCRVYKALIPELLRLEAKRILLYNR